MNALPNRQESQWYKIELFIPIENMDGYILLFTMRSSKSPLENYIEVLGKYLFLWASLADVDLESKFSYLRTSWLWKCVWEECTHLQANILVFYFAFWSRLYLQCHFYECETICQG